jgi:hypothetical protein
MHILISIIYGCTLWLSAMACAMITGGKISVIALAGPFIISAGAIAISALSYAACKLHTRLTKSVKSNARA